MALRVPPGSVVLLRTVGRTLVIVLVFGREELVVLVSQRVTCWERTCVMSIEARHPLDGPACGLPILSWRIHQLRSR